jgi:hypothetical protein
MGKGCWSGMERMRVLLEQMKKEDAKDQTLKETQPDRVVLTIGNTDLRLSQVLNLGCQPTVQTYNTYSCRSSICC